MAPPSPADDEGDFDLEMVVRQELAARENVTDYVIAESSPEHVLVRVSEQREDSGSERVLYRIRYEPRPDGTDDTHWEYLGPVGDDNSSDESHSLDSNS